MIYGIIIFIVLMVVISIFDFSKVKTFDDFAVAGKNQGFMPVFLSLMSSMIGASATIGLTDRVYLMGFPAFWWLVVGAIGLILQAILLSGKIRSLNANTLPDIADKTIGSGGRRLLAVIIAISWIGIIGAQIVSIAKIIGVVAGSINESLLIIIISLVVIFYTMLGGQLSVIKTDMLQAGIIFLGIIGTFAYLYAFKGENNQIIINNIDLLNSQFDYMDLINLFFITGGTYFLGPDIISRNLVSRDGKTAQKTAFLAGVFLFLFGIIITLTGMWAVVNLGQLDGVNPLIYIMDKVIPGPLAILLCLALIATLLSSADTCLVNAATIIEHDLLRRDKVKEIRIIIGIIGIASLVIALTKADIINLLLGAYSIYSPGIVFPLFFAIWCYGKRKINKPLWYMAVIIGGAMGVLNTYFLIGGEFLPLAGMGVSFILSLFSVLLGRKDVDVQ